MRVLVKLTLALAAAVILQLAITPEVAYEAYFAVRIRTLDDGDGDALNEFLDDYCRHHGLPVNAQEQAAALSAAARTADMWSCELFDVATPRDDEADVIIADAGDGRGHVRHGMGGRAADDPAGEGRPRQAPAATAAAATPLESAGGPDRVYVGRPLVDGES